MPGRELVALAHVDDRPFRLVGTDQGDTGDRLAFCPPRLDAAVDLPRHALVADGQALADELGAVLSGVEDEHQRRSRLTSQPSQLANCGRSMIDTDPGTWLAAKDASGRTSTMTAPSATSRSTAPTSSGARAG